MRIREAILQIFSGGRSKVLQVTLGTSVNLGEIRI
jgi:hypothetical protein